MEGIRSDRPTQSRDLQRLRCANRNLAQTHARGRSFNRHPNYKRTSGTERRSRSTSPAAPLYDDQHKIRAIIGFFVDITEIKKAEEARRLTEEKYRTIFENAIEGIYQITPQGKYISVNPAMARMFGFDSPSDLLNARTDVKAQEYVHPERCARNSSVV